MAMLTKKTIRTLGILFTTFFFLCAIVSIILAGIDYKYANPDWRTDTPYSPVAALQIATIIYTFVIAFFGYIVFIKPSIAMTIIFAIFLLLSLLFNLAIGILSIVAASHGWLNTYFGCNGRFDGLLGVWQGVDTYLQLADQNLCSKACPCMITNSTAFTTNSTVLPYYNQWEKSLSLPGIIAFQNCSNAVQAKTYNDAVRLNRYFDPEGTFVPSKFYDYMNDIEQKFHCNGWCNVTYFNTNTNKNTLMAKYLFSNVNRGPPERFGCLDSIIEWLPPYLNAFGAVTIVLAGCQLIVFALALMQCYAREKDHEEQIPHHHDENRQ